MNVKSKFCPAPWYHLSTDTNGSLRPCCKFSQPQLQQKHKMPFMYEGRLDELWNSNNFKSLRQDFIDGKQPKECEICWNEENNNVRSYRENLIDWLKYDILIEEETRFSGFHLHLFRWQSYSFNLGFFKVKIEISRIAPYLSLPIQMKTNFIRFIRG